MTAEESRRLEGDMAPSQLDKKKFADLVRIHAINGDVITRDLRVADLTAITLCQDNKLPILVFELLAEGNIARAVKGEKIGTLVNDQGTRA